MKKFTFYFFIMLYILSTCFASTHLVYAQPEGTGTSTNSEKSETAKKDDSNKENDEETAEEEEIPKESGLDEDYVPKAEHMFVCDAESGFEVYAKNSTKSINPYSFTKILTAITALENTKNINSKITVAPGILKDYDYSYGNIGIMSGENLSVKTLVSTMLLCDAGDCAIALAHGVGKDYNNFIKLMNDIAQKAGAKDSVFTEPAGFHDSKQKTTLEDMAKITRYALKNEDFKEIAGLHYVELPATNKRGGGRYVHSKNYFMSRFYSEDYYNENVRGVHLYTKGDTEAGLIIRYANGNDNLLILTAKSDIIDDANYAYEDTLHLIKKGKGFFTRVRLVKKEEFVSEAKLKTSKGTGRVLIISMSEIYAKLPSEYKSGLITREITLNDNIDAPLEKYDELGTLTVKYDGITVGTAKVASYSKIEKSILKLIKNCIIQFICSIYFIVLLVIVFLFTYFKRKRKSRRNK